MADEIGQPTHAQKILAKVRENRDSIYIGRVPLQTKLDFVAFADQEFCSDFGMALKWLMDGIPKADIQMLAVKIDELEARLSSLEAASQSKKSEEKRVKKMLNGKEVQL